MEKTLGCYESDGGDLYLGERYGYRLLSPDGFNYITGGGGIVFSIRTVKKLIERCSCPTSSAPDDMIIGICLKQLGIEPIHSSLFHQVLFLVICVKWNILFKKILNYRLGQRTIRKNYSPIRPYRFINFGKLIRMKFIVNGFTARTMRKIIRRFVQSGKMWLTNLPQ